jgi:carbon storage regulator
MLVLSRKLGERIIIGENVTVTIVRIGPNNVRVGIEAPRNLNIVREELCVESSAAVGELRVHSPDETPSAASGA